MTDLLVLVPAAMVIFLLAAVAQAVSGFGSALLAIPLLVLVVDPVTAVVAATGVSLVMSVRAWRRERDHVLVPVDRRLIVSGLLGMPLGLGALVLVAERTLAIVIGTVVLGTVVAMAARVRLPTSRAAQWGTGAVSGALLTSTGMNGPPLVLLLQGLGAPARSIRATLQAVFSVQDAVALAAFVVTGVFGLQALVALVAGCAGIPLGWAVGDRIFHRLSPEAFRRIVLVGLAAAAVVCLVQAA